MVQTFTKAKILETNLAERCRAEHLFKKVNVTEVKEQKEHVTLADKLVLNIIRTLANCTPDIDIL